MRRWSVGQLAATVAFSVVLWAILASACLLVGSTGSLGWPDDPGVQRIRIGYVLVASLVGAALAAAGVVYQAILRNPLADPYLLGVSSGASLFAYLWQLPAIAVVLGLGAASKPAAPAPQEFGPEQVQRLLHEHPNSPSVEDEIQRATQQQSQEKQHRDAAARVMAIGQQAFAFVGAACSVAIVFTLASRRGRLEPVTLLLVGVIVNAVNASVFLLINALVKDPAGGPFRFLVGGLPTQLTTPQWWATGLCVLAGWTALMYLSGQLNVAGLSEAEAQSLGVRIHRLRWAGLIVASIVTASAVAISGPIGFVGLICPHVARLIVGNDQRRLLPLSTALGAGLLAIADAASRWMAQSAVETTLPVGVLTGLLGGPFFLLLLWRSRTAPER